jgi:hypothetical protein
LGVATKLYHEIENFDGSTGMLTAWVNIPIVHSTEDTSLYMYYGNSSSSNQQFSEKTWDAKYLLVYHMKDETSSTIKDSTRNDNDGTKCGTTYPVESNGKIGKTQYFDGNVSCYMTSNKAIAHGSNPFTYECWYKADSYGHSEDPYPTDQYAPFFTINPPGQTNNVLAIVSANRTVNSVTKDRYRCYFQGSGASGYSVTDNLNHFNDV